jgi:D-amino-acid dehydrogenase
MKAPSRIVVVGGGIVAASVAYHASRQGASVILVEADRPGSATAAGAGIICPWVDLDDDAYYRLCSDGAAYYPELLAMLAEDGYAQTSYARVGALCVGRDDRSLNEIAAALRSRQAARPDIGDVQLVAPGEPRRMFPPLAEDLAAVWVSGGARIDGRQIRDVLVQAAARHGTERISGTAALEHSAGRVTGVTVGSERIPADAVVVAAGAWTADVCAAIGHVPIGPQRGQIIHAELAGMDTASWPVVLPPGDPYLLGFPGGRVVLGATREQVGFEHRSTVGGVGALLAAAIELAPGLADATLLETRIGFRPVTSDGRPLIGRLTEGLIVAAGNGPEGLTAGPWTGLAAAALALAQPQVTDLAPFDPGRFGNG